MTRFGRLALPRRSDGRTLIELMVAITLGLLILAGVASLYLGASRSTQQAIRSSQLAASAETALGLIGRSIRLGGYAEIRGLGALTGTAARPDLLVGGTAVRGCSGARFLAVTGEPGDPLDCSATDSTGDSIAVVYQADNVLTAAQGLMRDCLGLDPPESTIAVNGRQARVARDIYFLSDADASGARQLMCLPDGSPTPQPVAFDVDDLRVFYAVDNVGTAARPSATAWLTAADVADWDRVVAVHVCLLVRATAATRGAGAVSRYRPCPTSADEARTGEMALVEADDGVLRRAVAQTFTLRSRAAPRIPSA